MGKGKFKIEEALKYYNDTRKIREPKLGKIDLAKELFKGVAYSTMAVNMSNLINGRTSRMSVEMVKIICKITRVDANFLFGIKGMFNKNKKE